MHRAAGFDKALPRQPLRLVHVTLPALGVLAALLCRFELCDDPRETLRQGVMDLARHPLALVEDTGLSGLG